MQNYVIFSEVLSISILSIFEPQARDSDIFLDFWSSSVFVAAPKISQHYVTLILFGQLHKNPQCNRPRGTSYIINTIFLIVFMYFHVDFSFTELAQVSWGQFLEGGGVAVLKRGRRLRHYVGGRGQGGRGGRGGRLVSYNRCRGVRRPFLILSFRAAIPLLPRRPAPRREAEEDRETKQHMFIWARAR